MIGAAVKVMRIATGEEPEELPDSTKSAAAELGARGGERTQSPLEYMLRVMRDATAEPSRRDDMAKAAAPYIHARLSTVVATVGGELTLRDLILQTQQQPGDGAIDVTPRGCRGSAA